MITIEPLDSMIMCFKFSFDNLAEMYILDDMLSDRYKIISADGNTLTVVHAGYVDDYGCD